MINSLLAVDVHRGLLARSQNLYVNTAAGQGLPGRFEGPGIPAAATVIAAVAVLAVHRVPTVRQIHALPALRKLAGQAGVLLNKFPALVQLNYVAHDPSLSPLYSKFCSPFQLLPRHFLPGLAKYIKTAK